jgi:hypothetical protein
VVLPSCQTYGYNHIGTLSNLEQLGLIKKYDGSPPFASIKKMLRLIVTDVNEKEPNDIAYVYSGYTPTHGNHCSFSGSISAPSVSYVLSGPGTRR